MLEGLRWIHISAGTVGLVVYWIPVVTRKGGSRHRYFGRVFKWAAYLVLSAAALAVSLRLLDAAAGGIGPRNAPSQYAFLVFLGYLTVVTFVMVRHGVGVLEHKRDLAQMNRPLDRSLAFCAMAASVALVGYALYFAPPNRIVLFSLSPVGLLIGKGVLDAITGKRGQKNAWLLEHLGAMLGAGVAFHTAFAVFGLTRLFDIGASGWIAAIPWVLPTLVGVPATFLWSRKYEKKAPRPAGAIG